MDWTERLVGMRYDLGRKLAMEKDYDLSPVKIDQVVIYLGSTRFTNKIKVELESRLDLKPSDNNVETGHIALEWLRDNEQQVKITEIEKIN